MKRLTMKKLLTGLLMLLALGLAHAQANLEVNTPAINALK